MALMMALMDTPLQRSSKEWRGVLGWLFTFFFNFIFNNSNNNNSNNNNNNNNYNYYIDNKKYNSQLY